MHHLDFKAAALVLAAAVFAAGFAGCSQGKEDQKSNKADGSAPPITVEFSADALPQFTEPAGDEELAVMHTTLGDMVLRFFPEQAPKAVENFITHAKNGYYDNVTFHRVIQDFMIQGGDPEGTGMGGESIWGEGFAYELSDKLFHFRGALCMAHSSLPDSNGSQFYIVQGTPVDDSMAAQMEAGGWPADAVSQYKKVGGTPQLDQGYTVFGQLLGGEETLDKIAASETDANDKPKTEVKILSIEFKPYSALKS